MTTITTIQGTDRLTDSRSDINTNFTNLKTDKVETSDYTDSDIKTKYENNADTNAFTDADETRLAGIEALAEVNNISDVNATDLTDGGDTSLHTHTTTGDVSISGGVSTYNNVVPSLKGGRQVSNAGTVGGTVDAITAPFVPVLTLADKTIAVFRSIGENTSTTPTFSPDGLTAKTITKRGASPLLAGDIGPSGTVVEMMYQGATDQWELMTPVNSVEGSRDVTLTGPVAGQALTYNGLDWVNQDVTTTSAGAGVTFFNSSPTIIDNTTDNDLPVLTLANQPITTSELTISGNINGATLAFASWEDGILDRTSIDSGIWRFNSYVSVSGSGGITTLTRQIYSVLPDDGGSATVTITGTGASRTVTATGGTPFEISKIDASATNTDSSYIRTDNGMFQITGRTSDTIATITTPTTYSNESAVSFNVYKKLFGVTTEEINNTTVGLIAKEVTEPSFTITTSHKIGEIQFVTTTQNRTLTVYYDGTEHNTSFQSPLTVLHNDLVGIQGGAEGQRNHLDDSEYTGTGTGDFVRETNPTLTTPNIGDATALSVNKFVQTINGTAATGLFGSEIDDGNFTEAEFYANRYEDTVGPVGSVFFAGRGRGTKATPVIVQDGDSIFSLIAGAYDGTDFGRVGSIRFDIDGTPGNNDTPAKMVFGTTAVGTDREVDRMAILPNGNLDMLTNDIINTSLDLTSNTLIGTKAQFDTAVSDGNIVYVGDDITGKSASTDALNSATTTVDVSAATAPTVGQVLTAISSTAATWQTPAGGGGGVSEEFYATQASGQSLTTSLVKATFDTETYDTDANFNTTLNRYVAPSDGLYQFTTNVTYFSATDGDRTYKQWRKNGTSVAIHEGSTNVSGRGTLADTINIELLTGDYIEVYIANFTATRGTTNSGTTSSYFTGHKLK